MSKHFTNMREMMMKNEPLEEKGQRQIKCAREVGRTRKNEV
jgi:hypothetical protein